MEYNPFGVILAISIVVLPDLLGLAFLYTPLALIIVNEFEVDNWSHVTYDTSVIKIPQEMNSILAVITPIEITTQQQSQLLGLTLPLSVSLFIITMCLHWSNVGRWLKVIRRSYRGVDVKSVSDEDGIQDVSWFETWLCGILKGVHDNLKRSHTDVFNELYHE